MRRPAGPCKHQVQIIKVIKGQRVQLCANCKTVIGGKLK